MKQLILKTAPLATRAACSMTKMNRALVALALVCAAGGTQAVLVIKTVAGDAVVYDDVNNLTWLRNWNLFNGLDNWAVENLWAANLQFAGVGGWRLPDISEFSALYAINSIRDEVDLRRAGFTNVQPSNYWSGTEYAPDPSFAWSFMTTEFFPSHLAYNEKTLGMYAVAVHSGDLAPATVGPITEIPTLPIPEPETYALMLAGLALVSAAARRKKPTN
jgi:hypothetical protein